MKNSRIARFKVLLAISVVVGAVMIPIAGAQAYSTANLTAEMPSEGTYSWTTSRYHAPNPDGADKMTFRATHVPGCGGETSMSFRDLNNARKTNWMVLDSLTTRTFSSYSTGAYDIPPMTFRVTTELLGECSSGIDVEMRGRLVY